MKVLIAVDGSSGSFEAARQIGHVLMPVRDQIALYYSPPTIKLGSGATAPNVLDRARAALAEAVFDEAKSALPVEMQSAVELIIGKQPAKQGVVSTAESWGADLIVVGARGLGPIERLMLGSVSTSVAHSARVPVLVARARPADRQGMTPRVLIACESAQQDGFLVDVLSRFRWPAGTEGLTLSVVPSMFAGHVPKWLAERARSAEVEEMAQTWLSEHQAEIQSKQAEMAAFETRLPEPFQARPPLVVEGHAADQILATIVKEKIDLVVMGARGGSSMAQLLVGTTSETVLRLAPCSVLVVRDPARN